MRQCLAVHPAWRAAQKRTPRRRRSCKSSLKMQCPRPRFHCHRRGSTGSRWPSLMDQAGGRSCTLQPVRTEHQKPCLLHTQDPQRITPLLAGSDSRSAAQAHQVQRTTLPALAVIKNNPQWLASQQPVRCQRISSSARRALAMMQQCLPTLRLAGTQARQARSIALALA